MTVLLAARSKSMKMYSGEPELSRAKETDRVINYRLPNGLNVSHISTNQTTDDCNTDTSNRGLYCIGFPALQDYQLPRILVFLLFYLLILVGNITIITVVVVDPKLHKPMYFFLTNLSVLDILFTTTTIPKMLAMFLVDAKTISFQACFLQMYSFHGLTVTEALILVVMSYDRYEAICNPLHYAVKMAKRMNIQLAASAWITALIIPAPVMIQTSQLAFGETTKVYHCFCDHLAVVQAACPDFGATFQTFLGFCIAMTVSLVPLTLVILSYALTIISVLKIDSKEGQRKAFPTCTSHLIVVGSYYSSVLVSCISYRVDVPIDTHLMSNVVFAILSPLLNPLIYTLHNREVRQAIRQFIVLKIFSPSKNIEVFWGEFALALCEPLHYFSPPTPLKRE
ncbi:olfactory receptor 2AT4-like [Alligator sinensis]|uniref:Olfactory receptor 2AT4-like n=1 Tax=Alligator sinensis TaxID=38654 RepID=A0A1U7SJ82_ALLSI|nr:olfactory receptor 2AT4-like [Alligator sinensis]